MATYYVRNDGNDANTGLGSTTALAWRTVQKALGATGIGSGDTVYIAPGVYRENITIAGTYTAATYIIGDPTAAQFAGVSQGLVRLTNYLTTDTASSSGTIISSSGKNYINISYLYFDGSATMVSNFIGTNWLIENCAFVGSSLTSSRGISSSFNTGITVNNIVRRCIFMTGGTGIYTDVGGGHTSDWSLGYTIQDCAFIGTSPVTASTPAIGFYRTTGAANLAGGINIYNCYIQSAVQGIAFDCGNPTYPTNVRNCIITNCSVGIAGRSTTVNIQDYNRIIGCTVSLSSVATGPNTVTVGPLMVDIGMSQLFGLSAKQTWFSALPGSLNIGFGDPTGALTSDLFGQTWFNGGSDPDAGALTSIQLSNTSYYYPTERNANTITIAPGSTSQSIELYLGVTGLTASTSGLSARYNRTRTASVSIPLVARTIAQAWTSGGFAEVDATNMPGVYRLDLPDAALAAGADDVTIVVRGASGTNGAVVTVTLSSGGLTSAQTASAVWGASPAGYNDATTFGGVVNQIDATVTGTSTLVQDIPSNVWQEQTDDHTTHGTYGYNILRADAPSKEGLVTLHQSGGISRIDADIHAVVNDTAAAAELKGALLHNGTDYISADLLSPITSAQTVRIGPFAVRTDAGGADGALDLNQFTAGAVVVQLTDAQGTGIDQTSATVQAKVYNVAGGLVATYTCTPAYAVNGFVSIPMTTAVTGTAGSYIINLWSTVGATVIIYGPLQLRVRAI